MTDGRAPNGVTALFSLNGAPVAAADAAILFGARPHDALAVPGGRVLVHDAAADFISIGERGDEMIVFHGILDDPAMLAARLGIAEREPAMLAAAAHDRWGRGVATDMPGEWLLLRWHSSRRTLALVMSACMGDRCFVATDGRRVALAPTLAAVSRLPWVDAAFDPDMVMRSMARADLRMTMGRRTILEGVDRMLPGASMTIGADSVQVEQADAPIPLPHAAIGFDDAIAELDAMLRGIVRRRLARAGTVAVQLSGGLDSSLLALLAAEERLSGQDLVFLCSAAPPGSGLPDETEWAAIVARHLGVPLVRVVPHGDADVYRPSARMLALNEMPALSPRHYLYEALYDAARAAGADLVLDGAYGEMTVSSHATILCAPVPTTLRGMARRARDAWRVSRPVGRVAPYHVMPARAVSAFHAVPGRKRAAPHLLTPDAPFGTRPGSEGMSRLPSTTTDPRLRVFHPFRDPALLRLMAGFPAGIVRHAGQDRAPVRALLRGRLPDTIVDRPKGTAFSPSYDTMLRTQAAAARDRLGEQRRAGAADWLDLDWLAKMLESAAAGRSLSVDTWFRLHATAYGAEFFRYWDAR